MIRLLDGLIDYEREISEDRRAMTDNEMRRNSVMRFFSHPTVGITGSIASVLGLGLAIFFFLSGQKSRDLTWYVHPVKATVVKSGQASHLSVRMGDDEINSDVTAIQVAIWNRGGLSIRPTDVLKPIRLTIPESRVLDASVRKESRDVVNMVIDATSLAQGTLGLSWDILEEGDGAIVQIVYAGPDTLPIEFDGVVEGQHSLSRVQYPGKLNKPDEQYKAARRRWFLCGLALIFLGVIELFMLRRLWIHKFWLLLVLHGITICGALGYGFSLLLRNRSLGPPFGF
jgi:hypothetical protein